MPRGWSSPASALWGAECGLAAFSAQQWQWLSRKLDDSLKRRIYRSSQPTIHAAGKAGVAAQEKATPFFLTLDAGAALQDGPQRNNAGLDVKIDVPAGVERA